MDKTVLMNMTSPAPRISVRRRPPNANASILKWLMISFGALVAMLAGMLLLLLFGVQNGIVGLLTGMICATLPVPIYMSLILWIDRFEPEPPWLLAFTFLWGALIAPLIAVIFNIASRLVSEQATGNAQMSMNITLSLSAPFSEELMKGSVLFIVFFWRKADFDGVLDGIVYAGMAALGFAMTENIEYYGQTKGNLDNLLTVLILRGVMSPFAHPLFTCMTGIGLGISREARNIFIKVLAPFCGLGMAMLVHSLWNTSTWIWIGDPQTKGIWFIVVYFLVMVPLFFGVLGIVVYALIREGRMVKRNLAPELASGVLSDAEVAVLGSVFKRFGASTGALFSAGPGGWLARRRFHEAASHLAFHRNRVTCGTIENNSESAVREEELVFVLVEQRKKVTGRS